MTVPKESSEQGCNLGGDYYPKNAVHVKILAIKLLLEGCLNSMLMQKQKKYLRLDNLTLDITHVFMQKERSQSGQTLACY